MSHPPQKEYGLMLKSDRMLIYVQTLYHLSFIKCLKHYYIFNQNCTFKWTCQCYHDMCLHFHLPFTYA